MKEKLVLIDGHSMLFRAFHGMPPMNASDGTPTNAIFGFLRIFFKILDDEKPDCLAVAFDTSAPTFRHKMYDAYKGTRKPAPDEFKAQEPVMHRIIEAMQIPIYSMAGWEADDILGTLAKEGAKEGYDVRIVSGDHDLLQIADDDIAIVIPSTRGGKTETATYFAKDVLEQYEVTPREFIDVKALMGDSSDNIPGLPGVGKVTATKLIKAYGSIEEAHKHTDEIKPKKAMEAMRDHFDSAVLSKELATISIEAPVSLKDQDVSLNNIYTPEAYEIFKNLGFKSFYDRFDVQEEAAGKTIVPIIVKDRQEADRVFEKMMKAEKVGVSLALENGLYGVGLASNDTFYGMACSQNVQASFDFSALGISSENVEALDEAYFKEKLTALVKCGGRILSCDVKGLRRFLGLFDGSQFFDAVVAAYLLAPLKSDYDYDDIAAEYLNITCPSKIELVGKKGFAKAPGEDAIASCCAYEAAAACLSEPVLRKCLEETKMASLFDEIEMPLTAVLASMEQIGILADPAELKAYGENLAGRIEALTRKIYEEAGEQFNINSPRQLGDILFVKMGLPGGKKTKTGYSTAADVLEKMAGDVPFVSDVLEYRQLAKLKSTYADALADYIAQDGRIHTTFNQTVTATGRLSSQDPNLQNIPMKMEQGRLIRKCFIPKDGCVFVDADYSQIELRILAHMSGDEALIDAYRTSKDIHRLTASQVFNTPFDEVTPLQRRNAKAVNFGIIYGISSFGLSQGLSITPKEADKYIKDYFAAYPSIHAFIQSMVEDARRTGYAVSLYGRRRPIPELSSANFMQRSFGERAAMNSPIQGTAADIMKIAMLRVYDRLKAEKMESRLILQIHDELLIEAPENEAEKAAEILREEMQKAADLSVVLEVECSTGHNWYEAK